MPAERCWHDRLVIASLFCRCVFLLGLQHDLIRRISLLRLPRSYVNPIHFQPARKSGNGETGHNTHHNTYGICESHGRGTAVQSLPLRDAVPELGKHGLQEGGSQRLATTTGDFARNTQIHFWHDWCNTQRHECDLPKNHPVKLCACYGFNPDFRL